MTADMHDDDAGLGLLELIVAVVVSGIVIVAMAMIFINSWRAQEQVISTTEATNRGQVVSAMIERAMRNALYFEVPPAEGGTVLLVRTSLPGEFKCQAFRLLEAPSPDFGTAQLATSASALPADNSTWAEWKTGIAKQGTTPYFAEVTGSGAHTLTYTFQIETDASPVSFTGDIAPRSGDDGKLKDGCW